MDNPQYAADCQDWVENDQCEDNPGFMDLHCAKSCGVCGEEGGVVEEVESGEEIGEEEVEVGSTEVEVAEEPTEEVPTGKKWVLCWVGS